MRITKDRLSQIILEEASKMDGSEPDQIEEGIFDFLKGEKQETHNQKLNRAFRMLYQKDKHLESLIAGLSKQLDKISEKLFGVEEQPDVAPKAEHPSKGSREITTTQIQKIPRVGNARKYDI